LREFLGRHRRIGIDTCIFIYELEANPRYVALSNRVFEWLEETTNTGITSTITMTELLVQPYRDTDDARVNLYYGLLSTYPNLDWVAPDLEIADIAARFRAEHRLRTPDALQAATAAHSKATGFITNDPVFKRVEALEGIVLDDLL
jgi:predicted nucleic acid-binding protein